MKILEIAFSLANGGAERFVVDLSNELCKEHEVVLLTLKDNRYDKSLSFYQSDLSNKVQFINLGLPEHGFHVSNPFKVMRAVNRIKPDIVHIHGKPIGLYCSAASFLLCHKYKFFQTIHSDPIGYMDGYYRLLYATIGRFHKFRFITISNTAHKKFSSWHPKCLERQIDNGRAPMTPSSSFNEVSQEMASYKKNHNSKLFIHVATCDEVKNQQLLINSFNQIILDGYNADLVIIGRYFDSPLGVELRRMSCERIHYIGIRKNIADYMLNADVFCLSSKVEGMPMTMLEACLCGVPSVSTPVSGAVDLIDNGENGYLSANHTKEAYVITLKKSIDNYLNIKQEAMRRKDDSPYTIKTCAQKYISFFKE